MSGSSCTSPSIRNAASCGRPFFLDTTALFQGTHYNLVGLPFGTGLRISDSGVLSGTPNSIDASTGNLLARVIGSDQRNSCTITVRIDVSGDCGKLTPSSMQPFSNFRSGFAEPPVDANTGILPVQLLLAKHFYTLDVSRISFSGLRGQIQYEADGLPTGLSMDEGVISGTPALCRPSPSKVTLRATQRDKTVATTIYMQVNCKEVGLNQGVALPPVTAIVGELLYYDCAPYFLAGESAVTFEVTGLASGSSLQMSSTGVLSGIPTAVDVHGPALLITARDAAGTSVSSTLALLVLPQLSSDNSPPFFIGLEVISAPCGKQFSLNIGQRFFDKDEDTLQLSMPTLSTRSGMRFNNKTGILSGIPTDFDCQQAQPLRFISFADDGRGGKTEGPVYVSFASNRSVPSEKGQAEPVSENRDPVPLGIKRQVATQGVPFLLGLASMFMDPDQDMLSFSLEGLPQDTGLAVDGISGLISGTPTQADADAQQPIALTVTVTDGQGGSCSQMFLLTVFHGEDSVNHDPDAQDIPDAQAFVDEALILRLASSFADPDGDLLTYSVQGLPPKSGLAIITNAGVLAGTPTSAAQAASPLSLTVQVSDGRGGTAKSFLKLTVSSRRPASPSIIGPIPRLSVKGDVNFAAGEYLRGGGATYAVYGLPVGTGLVMNNVTGVLTGSPSKSDLSAKQPLVAGIVACGTRTCIGDVLYLTFQGTPSLASDPVLSNDFVTFQVSGGGTPVVKCQINSWCFFQTSRLFPSGTSTYTLSGLSDKSGLTIDANSGVLSGTPTLEDVVSADSYQSRLLPVIVSRTSAGHAVNQSLFVQFVMSLREANQAPFARSIPKSVAAPGKKFILDVWSSFADPDGDELQFSAIGLPEKSGFSIVPSSGVFFGIPSPADLAASQPLIITVIADDNHGGRSQENLMLSVSESAVQGKSCRQLGWRVASPAVGCARAPKVDGGCPSKVSFEEAKHMCEAMGARLCSSQELSEFRYVDNRDDCDVSNERVWTSSVCAFAEEVITQAGSNEFRGTLPKRCDRMNERVAMLKCCADSDSSDSSLNPITVSKKTCDQLGGFVTAPSSPNKAVCSSAAVQPKKGKTLGCSGLVPFAKAVTACTNLGARLCTAEELSQDIGNDQTCGYSDKRVWTSSECSLQGQMVTQAGSSSFLRSVFKQCTPVNTSHAVYCCADQRSGEYFQRLEVTPSRTEVTARWSWKLYPEARVSYRKASASKNSASWTLAHSSLPMAGEAQLNLERLDPNTRYAVRILPVDANHKAVDSQAVEFRVSTL